MATYQKRYGMLLYGYCLTPNHVHLSLRTSDPPLAKSVQLRVVADHLAQARVASIVHVGRGEGHVPQQRRLELPEEDCQAEADYFVTSSDPRRASSSSLRIACIAWR